MVNCFDERVLALLGMVNSGRLINFHFRDVEVPCRIKARACCRLGREELKNSNFAFKSKNRNYDHFTPISGQASALQILSDNQYFLFCI